jgi:chemotaxis signal transduction protein
MDLPFFLGLTGRNKPNKLLVLKHEEASLAFLVDTVVKIVSEEGVSVIKTADKKFAVATIGLNEGEAIQLDLEAIVCKAEISMQKKAVIIKNITNK